MVKYMLITKIKSAYEHSRIYSLIEKTINNYFKNRLKNENFTIVCPNCIGGQIYHRFSHKFDSPLINLSINTDDFIKFLNHFDYYIQANLKKTTDRNDGKPRAIIEGENDIPDITLTFVHYDSFEEGASKWYERRNRINKENMYLIMFDIDDIYNHDYASVGYLSDEQLKVFESFECNNKVVFTRRKDCKSKYAFYIKPRLSKPLPLLYFSKNFLGLRHYECKFNLIKFFNTKHSH